MIPDQIIPIKLLAMDVDGVLTDGSVIYTDSGLETKAFNIQDGLGIAAAKYANLTIAIITGRSSSTIERRAKELGIGEIYQNVKLKLEAIQLLCDKYALKSENIAFIGDDINDIPAFSMSGLKVAVQNASVDLKKRADYITTNKGGDGAVREVIELILRTQNKWDQTVKEFLAQLGFSDG